MPKKSAKAKKPRAPRINSIKRIVEIRAISEDFSNLSLTDEKGEFIEALLRVSNKDDFIAKCSQYGIKRGFELTVLMSKSRIKAYGKKYVITHVLSGNLPKQTDLETFIEKQPEVQF